MSNQPYRDFYRVISRVWRLYGGGKAILRSPYLHGSIAITAICYPYWKSGDKVSQTVLETVPSLLGFSIGAFAVLLAFSEQKIFEKLKNNEEEKSDYLGITVAFVFFILVQCLAIFFGLIGKAHPYWIINGIAFLLTVYSVATAAATSFRLFRLSRLYNYDPEDDQD